MNISTKLSLITVLAALGAIQAFGQTSSSQTGTSTLSLTVAPESAITVQNAALTEASGAGNFGSPFTGSTNFTYKIRTAVAAGGSITVQITSDFSDGTNSKPSVATPPAGDTLTYTCSVAAVGCASPVSASTTAATNVATFGNNSHSAQGANATSSGSVTWSLPNDPIYPAGSYTATATFTISTT
jgi:hypothetical protein